MVKRKAGMKRGPDAFARKRARARKRLKREMNGANTSEGQVRRCLEILERLVKRKVNPRTDDYLDEVDARYLDRAFVLKELRGRDISKYEERYDRVFEEIKRRWPIERKVDGRKGRYRFNEPGARYRKAGNRYLGVPEGGEDFPGEYSERYGDGSCNITRCGVINDGYALDFL